MTENNERLEFDIFTTRVNETIIECTPMFHQDYANAYIQAGLTDHDRDSVYVLFKRENEETLLLLRPDEAQAAAWGLIGAVHSILMTEIDEEYDAKKKQETETSQ